MGGWRRDTTSKDGSSQAQSADGVALDHGQVDFVPKQVADVIDAIQDHSGTFLQGQQQRSDVKKGIPALICTVCKKLEAEDPLFALPAAQLVLL